ncbi:MAG: hypothetical protein IVZ94_01120 [Nitrospirae bacterium]|nr:hypothetical protein [Nitrospirota bacterium]
MVKPLEKEFQYYLEHQNELVEKYNGKYLAIMDQVVVGVYDSEIEAIEETAKSHELGTFLVQKCEPGNESYTQTYHSRVVFA